MCIRDRSLSGYKDHTRTPGFNAGTMSNDWAPKKLTHDRDVEFYIDPMDIDETNLVMSVANIQTVSYTHLLKLRKIHSGLPAILVDTLAYLVKSDMDDVEFNRDAGKHCLLYTSRCV